MSATFKIIGLSGVAAVVQAAVSVTHAIFTAEQPPIELTRLAWNGYAVEFSRTVNADVPIRANVQNEVVDVLTESTVPGCLLNPPRRADFSPTETRDKVFPMSRFMSPGCQDALIPGREYALVSVIIPIGAGEPTGIRSDAFTWPGVPGP